MEENNIMTTDEALNEVEEVYTEEAVDNGKNGLGVGMAIGGLITLGGMFAYKKIIKPLVKKLKDKKEVLIKPEKPETIIVDANDIVESDPE